MSIITYFTRMVETLLPSTPQNLPSHSTLHNLLSSRYNQVYDLVAFGGIGDSTGATGNGTNNRQALTDAIETANTAGGGIIHIPKGIFRIAAGVPINTYSNISFIGLDYSSVLFFDWSDGVTYGNIFMQKGGNIANLISNVLFQNLTILGPTDGQPGGGAAALGPTLMNCYNVHYNRVQFKNIAGWALSFHGVEYGSVTNCLFIGCGRGGINIQAYNPGGSLFFPCNDVVVSHNIFRDMGDDVIGIAGGLSGGTVAKRIVVANNVYKGYAAPINHVSWGSSVGSPFDKVAPYRFINIGSGIAADNDTVQDVVIENNIAERSAGPMITMSGGKNVKIRYNIFRDAARNDNTLWVGFPIGGLFISDVETIDNLEIIGNDFPNCNGDIFSLTLSNPVIIKDNLPQTNAHNYNTDFTIPISQVLSGNDIFSVNTTSGAKTATLPPVLYCKGMTLRFVRSAGTNNLSLATADSAVILGNAGYGNIAGTSGVIVAGAGNFKPVEVFCDGTTWWLSSGAG